jgi:hypothetical protein
LAPTTLLQHVVLPPHAAERLLCLFAHFSPAKHLTPETIAKMSAALESVCEALSLKLVDDGATRLVAEKIIELAQRGVKDVATLSAMTLEQFKRQ